MKMKFPQLPSSVSTRKIDGRRIPRKVSFSVVVTPLLDISFVKKLIWRFMCEYRLEHNILVNRIVHLLVHLYATIDRSFDVARYII